MRNIRLFRHSSEEEVIKVMKEASFCNWVGFIPVSASIITVGMKIPFPDTKDGRVVAVRRHVIWFWRWEYLIKRSSDLGNFYEWFSKKRVTFCQ